MADIPASESGNADVATTISNALAANVRDLWQRPVQPGLHLVATPIGNLGDMSARALVTLARADEVYCEDSRVSGPMLARFGISRRLTSYHEHNAEGARRRILEQLIRQQSVALISDAGMPAISDPGFKLVREVIEAGFEVYGVPGPTALTTAVTVSGLPTDSFFFAGFLPQKSAARRTRIEQLGAVSATLIIYESPHRIADALVDLDAVLGNRQAALTRELTKRYEEVRRGTLAELAVWSKSEPPRGEIAIVVAGNVTAAHESEVDDATILEAARTALSEMAPAAAAKALAKTLGVPRSRVYNLILFLQKEQKGEGNGAG